ncbi:MAG: hypothetical protein GX963_11755 [Bacteroidales bacterium]|nr:hypothetical protein [Bacteroidales bacterium]
MFTRYKHCTAKGGRVALLLLHNYMDFIERKAKKTMFTGENISGVYDDRSMIWRIASSWWLLFSFSIGVLN